MTKITYPEAVKKARTEKVKENFMTVQIEGRLVLPYKDGLLLLQALTNAEKLNDAWRDTVPIGPLGTDTVVSHVLSPQEYERHKIAALMGISMRDLAEAEQAAAAAENNTT